MRKKQKREKGFSLVEILVAIAILGVLTTLAANAYNIYKKKARQQAYDALAISATSAASNYLLENAKTNYITLETLKEQDYLDSLQDPRYKDKQCSGIVINKVVQGETEQKIDVLFQKVKLCCKNYTYQYDYTGDDVKVTEIDSCEYIEGDEIDGMYKLIYKPSGGTECDPKVVLKRQGEEWGTLCETKRTNFAFKGWNTKKNGRGTKITSTTKVEDRDISAYAIWNEIFKLEYNEDGGSKCDPNFIKKENGEKWGTLCETEKKGYAFKGWRTKKNGQGTKITNNSIAESNLTVYAHWNPYITITFDSQGGTECNPKSITKEKGEEWGTLCTPTKTGYVFKGWNTKNDGTGTNVTSTSQASTNMTLFAIWNPIYTLTYDPKGGTECNPNSKSEENGKEWGKLCTTTRNGYNFAGWYNGTTKVTSTSTVTGNIKVEANWAPKTCNLTYDENGGNQTCASKTTKFGYAWGDLCVPTRTGYTFAGWTKDGSSFTKNTVCNKLNTTIKANWTINYYTLRYNDNDGSGCSSQSITKPYNTSWGGLCTPTRVGHTFNGWYNGTTRVTETSKAKKDIIVKADWTVNSYKLTYDDNGGSGCSSKSITTTYGSTWGTLCTPTRTGHTFTGWNTNANGTGTKITASSSVSGNKKVYAQWSVNTCKLSYNDNGGSGCSSKTSSKTYGTSNKWDNLCTSTSRSHYQFAGWNTKSDGSGTTVTTSTTTASVCDATLYAQWKKNNYTLSYSGVTGCQPITKPYNEAWGTLCSPQASTGYSLGGWKDQNGNYVIPTSKATGNITVSPVWTANTYTLTYDSNGGSSCSSQSGTYGYAWGTLCKPTKAGYNFDGWYSGTTQITSSSTVRQNLSVKAQWSVSSRATSVSATTTGGSSTLSISLTPSSPDTSRGIISATASNGNASCYYSGTTIKCTITGVSGRTVSTGADCKKLANINNVDNGSVYYLTNEYYNYSKWASDAKDGCYIKVAHGQGTKSTWTCMYDKAKNSFLVGSESHCRKQECGYNDCLTRGYETLSNGNKTCQCWRFLNTTNYNTIYDTSVTVNYYTFN